MLIGGLPTTSGTAIAGAIQHAAQSTGASFEYLLATARVESGLNPQASAKTSSARGLFQFVDRTWLATLKQAGPGLGYGRYANAIVRNANGQFEVPDPALRQQILALRNDPAANAAMAGAFTRANSAALAQTLGRPASDAELYMAHFLGAKGAGRLISLAAHSPETSAASAFPKAAAANPSIFYDRAGTARSVGDVYNSLAGRYDVARAGNASALTALLAQQPATASPVTPVSSPVATTVAAAAAPRSLFSDMFSGTDRREPVSDIVRELWSTRPQVAAALTGSAAPESSGAALGVQGVAPATPLDGLRNLYRDLPPSVRALFTTRS